MTIFYIRFRPSYKIFVQLPTAQIEAGEIVQSKTAQTGTGNFSTNGFASFHLEKLK